MTKEQMQAMVEMLTAVNSRYFREVLLEVAQSSAVTRGVISAPDALREIADSLFNPDFPSGAIH